MPYPLIKIKEYCNDSIFHADFMKYLNKILNKKNISKTIKYDIATIKDFINEDDIMIDRHVLSLIYAERNLDYHNGEQVRMNMNYIDRINVMNLYIDSLLKFILFFHSPGLKPSPLGE